MLEILRSYASQYNQTGRLFTLKLSGGNPAIEILGYELLVQEGINTHYSYQAHCISASAFIELKSLLGQCVGIVLNGPQGKSQRSGIISEVRSLGSDGGIARYFLRIESGFALLRHSYNSRVFQDQTIQEIVKKVLNEHLENNGVIGQAHAVEFRLSKPSRMRSYCIQYRESDINFVERILEEEGCYWYYQVKEEQEELRSTLIISDDRESVQPSAVRSVRFHRETALEQEDGLRVWQGRRQVVSSEVAFRTFDYKKAFTFDTAVKGTIENGAGNALQETLKVYDPQTHYYASTEEDLQQYTYGNQLAEDAQAKRFVGKGAVRGLQAGEWFVLEDEPNHMLDDERGRSFVVYSQKWYARNNLPIELTAILEQTNNKTHTEFIKQQVFDNGFVWSSSESKPLFYVELEAQRLGHELTNRYIQKARSKPRAEGVQTAIVVGPSSEEVHTDSMGRIKIQFHWQRSADHPEGGADLDDRSSCWVRVALPMAGAGWGHQYIPRIGQEVLVSFIENDIDRPVVAGVLYNGTHATPKFSGQEGLPGNKALSGFRSKEHAGENYNELLFDDSPGQVRTKLSSEHTKSQLNMGYLTHPRTQGEATPRGEGAELRTDGHIALRGGKGVLLTANPCAQAEGMQLERAKVIEQLEGALQYTNTLSSLAKKQNADLMETGPNAVSSDNESGAEHAGNRAQKLNGLRGWHGGTNVQSDAAGSDKSSFLVLEGPDGIINIAGSSYEVAAKDNIDLVTERDTNQTSKRRWLHNVGEHISLFVAGVKDKISLKILAGKGRLQIQAQDDVLELAAQKNVEITSSKEKIIINSKKEILLTSGGGYIRIANGNIEIHCPGKVTIKGASHSLEGPDSLAEPLPVLPNNENSWVKFDAQFDDAWGTKISLSNLKVKINGELARKGFDLDYKEWWAEKQSGSKES